MNERELQFSKIVQAHRTTVYTVCYMFSKDSDEVQDLFQETLINLWQGFESYRGEAKVETWIWRVALNTCLTAERKKKRRGERLPLEMAGDLFTDTDDTSKQVRMLHNRIGKLEVMDRALILLWLENMSYDDIALIVGITPKNVSVKLTRIKQELIESARREAQNAEE